MPILDIIATPLSQDLQDSLATRLTKDCKDILGVEDEHVFIRFHPVHPNNFYIGGQKDAAKATFQIDITWFAGKAPHAFERLGRRLTDSVADLVGVERGLIEVGRVEQSRENCMIGGTLLDIAPGRPSTLAEKMADVFAKGRVKKQTVGAIKRSDRAYRP